MQVFTAAIRGQGAILGLAELNGLETDDRNRSKDVKSLFEPVDIGRLRLKNRIVMAPLTRSRAGPARIPNQLMLEYYAQRAGAGLILTEATAISPMAVGYADTPGIWSEEQVAGWKAITEAVHGAGGQIVLQLWHVGRISHSSFLNGARPVAPSAVVPAGYVSLLRPQRPYEMPHALSREEIAEVIADYRKAAENGMRAGFDGVEIHGANGYLPDQFLESKTNLRTDQYGGPFENRARFLLDVADAVIGVWGADRVGVHLSPRGTSSDISDANPRETFGYVARELGRRKIAFLFLRERQDEGYLTPHLKREFGGPVIANEGIDPIKADELLRSETVDLVSFGRLYISNPDLVERLRAKMPLATPNPETFFSSGSAGYTDYPRISG